MTAEEAIAQIAIATALYPLDVAELLAAAHQDAIDGQGRLPLILKSIQDDGRAPDRTGWQCFEAIASQVPEWAGKVAPIVAAGVALLPLL